MQEAPAPDRALQHARQAGLLPFLLTPNDYEIYDMSGKELKEEEEEPVEESLSEKLNKAGKEVEEVASEDFAKLMDLLSSDDKKE